MHNRRRHRRHPHRLSAEVAWPGHGTAVGTTRDLSDGGVMLCVHFDRPIPENTEVTVELKMPDPDATLLTRSARVVRRVRGLAGGLALSFLGF